MKTTVALGTKKAIVIKPSLRGIRVDLTLAGVSIGGDEVTPDQAGALIFGIEQALEVWRQRLEAQGIGDVPY